MKKLFYGTYKLEVMAWAEDEIEAAKLMDDNARAEFEDSLKNGLAPKIKEINCKGEIPHDLRNRRPLGVSYPATSEELVSEIEHSDQMMLPFSEDGV